MTTAFFIIVILIIVIWMIAPNLDIQDNSIILWYNNFKGERKYIKLK